jgi:NAD(P)H-hydrate epimerase
LAADQTISFGGAKPCHLIAPSQKWCGKLVIADPGFPKPALAAAENTNPTKLLVADLATFSDRSPLYSLPRDAHKYERGHVLVMGGSTGKWGAPILAGVAAARCGAGWISIATEEAPPQNLADPHFPELTFEKISTPDELDRFVRNRRVRCMIIGPGWMGQKLNAAFVKTLQSLQSELGIRIIFDAGATAGLTQLLDSHPLDAMLSAATPHPGEWTKIFDRVLATDQLSDFDEIFLKAQHCGISLLYKSATPLLFQNHDGAHRALAITGGTGAVAKAGSGDVLCGVIAAHAMHCKNIAEAIIFAFDQFYKAGRISALQRGYHGVMPSDILNNLGLAL